MTASNDPGATQQAEEYDTGRAILLAAVAALGGFLFGFDTAVINGAVTAITEDFQMGPFLSGFAVASALLGCAAGAWLAGRVADTHGRIRVMLIAAVLFSSARSGPGWRSRRGTSSSGGSSAASPSAPPR